MTSVLLVRNTIFTATVHYEDTIFIDKFKENAVSLWKYVFVISGLQKKKTLFRKWFIENFFRKSGPPTKFCLPELSTALSSVEKAMIWFIFCKKWSVIEVNVEQDFGILKSNFDV